MLNAKYTTKTIFKKYRRPIILGFMALVSFLATLILQNYIQNCNSPIKKVSEFNNQLNERYRLSQKLVNEIADHSDSLQFQDIFETSLRLPPNYSLYVLKYDSIIFWSGNSIDFEPYNKYSRIVSTNTGYFQKSSFQKDSTNFVLLDLIKYQYPYQNEYLSSDYNPVYGLKPFYQITDQSGDFKITDKQNSTLFYLTIKGKEVFSGEQEFVLFVLLLLTIIVTAFAIYYLLISLGYSLNTALLFISIFIILVRIFSFSFQIPSFLKVFDLFSPLNYASSAWFPSLGDLLINTILISIISFLIYRHYKLSQPQIFNKALSYIVSIICLAVLNVIYYLSLHLLDTLIINSAFELNLSKILDFTIYSLVGYLIIALILLSFFYLSFILTRTAIMLTGKNFFIIAFLSFSISLWSVFKYNSLFIPQFEELIFFLIYILVIVGIIYRIIPFPHAVSSALLVVILTTISTFCLYHNSITKEQEERKLTALRLSSEQDKIAEYLYIDLENSILTDSLLYDHFMRAWYDPTLEKECIEYLKSHYITGFWSKYIAQVTLCYPDKDLEINPSGVIIGCNEYFNNIIRNITNPTTNKTLHYIRESYGINNYIAKIPIMGPKSADTSASIVIEFTQKYVPKGLGYPELLLDKSFTSFSDLSVYSYAIYSRGELIKNVGDYAYSLSEKPFLKHKEEYNFFDKNGYNHLYHIVNENTSIIISKRNPSILDKFAPFTYQLVFHILLLLIISAAYNLPMSGRYYMDLKTQLQIVLVAIVLFASVITGSTTLQNIRSLNNKKNKDMLSEKAHSVLIEIEHKLDNVDALSNSQNGYLQELLTKFSLVFFSDINLYTPDGKLLATSRPEIFNEGLRSKYMSTEAFSQISVNQRTFFVTNEQIGTYKYLSAYIPFRNKNNDLVAFINLPFFAREHELRQEISSFLVTFVNVYIILTALAVLVSLIVGNYVTRPLQLIRDQFSHVELDRKNEKISYSRHDELGNLINEYNIMLDKLADNVDKLAQSERESAWKEMARQIAHEIKNPLTPMKLSIQHLYRSWQDKTPDFELRLEKTTNSIIQQIDSLAAIASAFSDFAKFPIPSNEKVELQKVIKDTLALFTHQTNYSISFTHESNPLYVFADKKQITRVLVNLINNAIQSIPAERDGKIDITLKNEETEQVIFVSDNGSGIPEELRAKIFSPNFTTKSGGTGLGLAMVKNIINSLDGTISFKSNNDGTTFEIRLPVMDN